MVNPSWFNFLWVKEVRLAAQLYIQLSFSSPTLLYCLYSFHFTLCSSLSLPHFARLSLPFCLPACYLSSFRAGPPSFPLSLPSFLVNFIYLFVCLFNHFVYTSSPLSVKILYPMHFILPVVGIYQWELFLAKEGLILFTCSVTGHYFVLRILFYFFIGFLLKERTQQDKNKVKGTYWYGKNILRVKWIFLTLQLS